MFNFLIGVKMGADIEIENGILLGCEEEPEEYSYDDYLADESDRTWDNREEE